MATQPSLGAWKEFLNARIQQEKGNDEQALEAYDKLLAQYPGNDHFQSARTFALSRLGRAEAAAASNVAKMYNEIGKRLSGQEDRPDQWISELNSLLKETENFGGRIGSAVGVVW
jgi:hypothetical protein